MLAEHLVSAGPVAMILLGLSVLALALFLERLWLHLTYPLFKASSFLSCKKLVHKKSFDSTSTLLKQSARKKQHGWHSAVNLLLANRNLEDAKRKQLLVFWLDGERRYLNARLKLIGLLGAIAPLLGLLGTVFGIIEMFKDIAHSTGPVTPALLASGMWTAMVTTALGLLIAIPALAASHGLEQLSQLRINRIQDCLNDLELVIAEVTTPNAISDNKLAGNTFSGSEGADEERNQLVNEVAERELDALPRDLSYPGASYQGSKVAGAA